MYEKLSCFGRKLFFCWFVLYLSWLQIGLHSQLEPDLELSFPDRIQLHQTQIDNDPSLISPRLALAKIYLQIEAFDLAIDQYQRVRSIDPYHPNVDYGLGLAYSGQSKFDLAIESLHRELNTRQSNTKSDTKSKAHIYAALGSAYASLYQYEKAKTAYEQALNLFPDDAMIHHQLGNIISKQGNRLQLVIKHQQRAILLEPRLASAHLQLGLAYAKTQNLPSAITAYKQAIELDSGLVEAEYNLAQAYFRQGVPNKAEIHLRSFQNKKKKSDQIARLKGAFQRSTDQKQKAQISANIGRAYLKNNQYKTAIQYYQKSIGLDPRLPIAYSGIGLAYAMLNRYELAIFNQKKALNLQPDLTEALSSLGLIYLKQNKIDLALSAYQQSVKLKPRVADVQRQIGLIYISQQSYAQAEVAFKKALDIDPSSADNYHNLGLSLAYQDKMKSAIGSYLQSIKLRSSLENRSLAETYFLLAEAYNHSSNKIAAEKAYIQAIEIDDNLAKGLHALARLYGQKKEQPEKAIYLVKQAIKIEPEKAEYHNTLALLYYQLESYNLAQEALQAALAIEPENQSYQIGIEKITEKLAKSQ